jgi:NTE family protein
MRAVVLSGGGARGAYEAGALSYVLGLAALRPGPWADIVSGTSVGALTGALLAAHIDTPLDARTTLDAVWDDIELERVLRIGGEQILGLRRLILGGAKPAGLFDPRPLARIVGGGIPWPRITEHVAAGRLGALTITATHVPTGRPTVFLQRRSDLAHPRATPKRNTLTDTTITLDHTLASAAIPLLFPPVRIGGDLYCDGGLRQNTPLDPAVRLGARDVLIIALATSKEPIPLASDRYPSAAFLLGKVLDAFLLDHITSDVDELRRINRFLADGAATYGDDFCARMAERAQRASSVAFVPVREALVQPSENIGAIAASHVARLRRQARRFTPMYALLSLIDTGEAEGSDLASYLLFDRQYTRELVALGKHDAARNASAIEAFLDR